MHLESYSNYYISVAENCFLKALEEKYLYNTSTDELYSLNDEAFSFFTDADGTKTLSELSKKHQIDDEAFNFILKEKLIDMHPTPRFLKVDVATFPDSSIPSLRYLHVLITKRCNLSCRHCYLGKAQPQDMDISLFEKILKEFQEIGGLRLIVSGGEPTEHPEFEKINHLLTKKNIRSVLLTNGVKLSTLSSSQIRELNFDEIQISIDGLKDAHDRLRGTGTFTKAVEAAKKVVQSGKQLSIATIITRYNRHQFEEMKNLVENLGAHAWLIDFPVPAGRAASSNMMPFLMIAGL